MTEAQLAKLAKMMEHATIQDVIKCYAVHHPNAVATPEQVETASAFCGNDISIDSEAFVSVGEDGGYSISGWVHIDSESADEEDEDT